ncbi:MAG: ATP-grasp domain-containing protein, partial [Isosphaeraceae bacterium]|nr:ATP-grasp domain-containing protein [Isosphaeraceae bacterium]
MGRSAPARRVLVHEYVTGGGLAGSDLPASWAAEGSAMRRALAEDLAVVPGIHVVMTLDDRLPDEPGPWATVRVGPGQEPETFARLAVEVDYTIAIAPETGGTLLDGARILERLGARSLGCEARAIALAGDKLRMARCWQRHRIPTPPTRWVRPAWPLPEGIDFGDGDGVPRVIDPYPVVVKPVDGAGSVQTYLIRSSGDCWPDGALGMASALLQPYLPGVPMSASFLVDARGRATLVGVGRQRVEVRDGRFHYRGGLVPAGPQLPVPVEELWRAIAPVGGLRGWVGLDFLWDEATGRAVMLEINPRPTTSYVGLRRLLPPGELARVWLAAIEGPD